MGRTVSISLAAIQAEFGAAISQLQWVITVYALVLATFTLISGRMCDAYGTPGGVSGGHRSVRGGSGGGGRERIDDHAHC